MRIRIFRASKDFLFVAYFFGALAVSLGQQIPITLTGKLSANALLPLLARCIGMELP